MATVKNVAVTKDNLPKFMKALKALTRKEVLVGVPDETADRTDDEGSQITNAGIGYVMEFGAPEKNIPPRPFLVPGIQDGYEKITRAFSVGARKALSGDLSKIEQAQIRAGDAAVSAVQQKITDGPFVPLAESTIKNRARRHKSRKGEREYLDKLAQGMTPAELAPLNLVKPLIDTGQLRRSITFVIRERDKK